MSLEYNFKKGGEELLTVCRGSTVTEGERITKVWDQVVGGNIRESEVPGLIRKIKDSKWNYGGAFYSVYFRVNTAIVLHELGFFGPFKEEKASYFVHVEIFKPKDGETMPNSWDSPRVGKTKVDILAKKDELFYVDLGEGVPIEPSMWYLVQFKLEGPNTLKCESSTSLVTVEQPGCNVQFEFNKGSNQMPAMKFTLGKSDKVVHFYNTKC